MRHIIIWFTVTLLAMPAFARSNEIIGRIKNVEGIAYVQRGYNRVLCKPGLALHIDDIIRTLDDARLGLTLNDETSFALGPDTLLRIDQFSFDGNSYEGELEATLDQGTLAVRTGRLAEQERPQIKLKTKQSVLGVRGTYFAVGS